MRYIIKSVNQKINGQKVKLYYIYDTKERVTASANSPLKSEVERVLKTFNEKEMK